MKTLINILTTTLLTLSPPLAHTTPLSPSHYPPDLSYSGKPIDPLCFYNPESSSETISLKNCGLQKEKYQRLTENEFLTKKGFYGFDWHDPSINSNIHGYSYYKAWNAGKHQYWLFTVNSGGGSGDFTAINLYTRENSDSINFKTIANGDRCNGGITGIKEKNSGIQYGVSITPADFLTLAQDNPHHLQPYDDLAACAVCCAATAYYEVDNKAQPKLQYIELGKFKEGEMVTQGKYQGCFNKVFMDYVAKGKVVLSEGELIRFMRDFDKACGK